MIYDIWLWLSIPMTVSLMCFFFDRNYWDMAGISLIIVAFLKLFDDIPLIGVCAVLIGIAQIYYGHTITKAKREQKEIKKSEKEG